MTTNKIKAAALSLFAHQGYKGTALSEIAKIVGIKTPSIYAHFSSKEELFLSIFRDVNSIEWKTIERILNDGIITGSEEKLKTIFYELTSMSSKKDEILFYKRAIFFPPAGMDDILREEFSKYEARSTAAIKSIFLLGQDKGEIGPLPAEDLLASFYCMLDGLLVENHFYDQSEYEKRKNSVWRFFWQGIQSKKGD